MHNGAVRGQKKSLEDRQAGMRLHPGKPRPSRPRHGHTSLGRRSPVYKSWQKMIARCTAPSSDGYKHYGAKGVSVCDRWRVFQNFMVDMGPRPEGKTLGRVLDRGNYEPGNVSWMTKPEQGLHQRNNNSLRKWDRTESEL